MTEEELKELRRLGNWRPNMEAETGPEPTAEGFRPRLVEFPVQPPVRPHVGVRMMLLEYLKLADAGLIDGLVVVVTTGANWRYSATGKHMEQDPTRLLGAMTLATNQLSGFINAATEFEHRHASQADAEEKASLEADEEEMEDEPEPV